MNRLRSPLLRGERFFSPQSSRERKEWAVEASLSRTSSKCERVRAFLDAVKARTRSRFGLVGETRILILALSK